MVDALERLLAWRLDLAHVDPAGRTTVTSKGSNKYPEGAQVTLDDIIGHRDVGQTECPGDLTYAQLTAIRQAVAGIGLPKLFSPTATPSTIAGTQAGYAKTTLAAGGAGTAAWSLKVSHFALGEVRHLVATGDALSTTWDGTDDTGRQLPGGRYTVDIAATGPAGQARPGSVTVTLDNTDEPKPATRLAGGDRYGTAAAVSQRVSPKQSDDVVLASGEGSHLVDSLVAAPLAKAKGGPLLLTSIASLPPATAAELDRLQPKDAWIVGGATAVTDDVASAIAGRGITVHRLSGVDAPATAAAVAEAMGGPRPGAVVVSRDGAHLVDGLAASGPAAGLGRPVLLVSYDAVPEATSAELSKLGSVDVWAVGGPAAISDAVVAQLKARRVSGPDRWSTATAVADAAITAGLTPDVYAVASGDNANLVDALSGGAFAKPVVLTGRDDMAKVTWDELYSHREVVQSAWVLGGTSAIGVGPAADARHAINAG
jgi:putative cell wall-binding protein